MADELAGLWRDAVDRGFEEGFIYGRMGRQNPDGSISVETDRDHFVYVTLSSAASASVAIAFNPLTALIPNLPVKMRRRNGHLVVKEIDDEGNRLVDFLGGSAGIGAGPHTHKDGSGMEYEHPAKWLEPGRVKWSGTALTVSINYLRYWHLGVEKAFAGGNLDLSANAPAGAGKWAWVVVGINPASNTAVAVTGAEYDAQTDLTVARIEDINFLDYIPCAAIQMCETDTALSLLSRYRDAHHWFGQSGVLEFVDLLDTPASYAGAGSKWVRVNGAESALEFAAISSGYEYFYQLLDTPDAYTGQALNWIRVKAAEDGLEFFAPLDTFLELTDAPDSYSGQGTKGIRVNAGGTALEFYDFQPLDADLTSIASLAGVADRMLYATGISTWALATLTAAGRALLDDADASAQRTTLGLGTMALEAASAYLLLAGRAGGQTAYGGTGSGDDLILNSTSHSTKGYVLLQSAGGNVGIGKAIPVATLDIEGELGIGDGTNQMYLLQNWNATGGGNSLSWQGQTSGANIGLVFFTKDGDGTDSIAFQFFGVGAENNIANRERMIFGWDGAAGYYQIQSEAQGTGTLRPIVLFTEGNASQLYLDTNGRIGHGVASPTMYEFAHDGTSGKCFGTINVTSGTAQVILADGALDVKDYLFWTIIVDPSTGASGGTSGSSGTFGSTFTLFDSGGTEILVLHLNADGSVDIQRTAGTRTYVCSVWLFWQ